MNPALQVEVIDAEPPDLLQLRVTASSRAFSGSTTLFDTPSALNRLLEGLGGFPTHPTDTRLIELGTFDLALAGGGARIGLACTSSAGHAILSATVQTCRHTEPPESVSVAVPVEASAIDQFVAELAGLRPTPGQKASLLATG